LGEALSVTVEPTGKLPLHVLELHAMSPVTLPFPDTVTLTVNLAIVNVVGGLTIVGCVRMFVIEAECTADAPPGRSANALSTPRAASAASRTTATACRRLDPVSRRSWPASVPIAYLPR
jgi:hypothetical protein